MNSFEPVRYPNHDFEPTDETVELNKNLINGLIELGLEPNDIKENYKYSGGDFDNHRSYFNLIFKNNISQIKKATRCICKVKIAKNCYITKNNNIDTLLIIGNCCIKRFMKHKGRTCDECDEPHKNRLMNKCNNCKKKYKICHCGNIINKKYTSCFKCKFKDVEVKYDNCKCGKSKKNSFKSCYNCYNELKNQ
jgi:hypothetical protein